MLSTLPPTLCGLATFSTALGSALEKLGHSVRYVNVADSESCELVTPLTLVPGSAASRASIAERLSRSDVAIIQHEFGIYGGDDGEEILDLMARLRVPTIVVLHTVPARPNGNQARILRRLLQLSDAAVVLSTSAGMQLQGLVGVRDNVHMIPHGAATRMSDHAADPHVTPARGLVTWGLIGPGKGIEMAIRALGLVRRMGLRLDYCIAGVTHPKVARGQGDSYVRSLREIAVASGVDDQVEFDHVYRDVEEMLPFLERFNAVVLPYESREQVTSGVLVDSLAAGRPVIATAFPHAVELLADGSGELVEHGNVAQMAAAMARLHDGEARAAAAARAREIAPQFSWSAVAESYLALCSALVPSRIQVASSRG